MMRKTLYLGVTLLLVIGSFGFADTYTEEPFLPLDPEVMAMGGAFVAAAHGYNSFFYNPAGFAQPGGSFTLGSGTVWVRSRPDAVLDLIQTASKDSSGSTILTDAISIANSQLTTGGFGVGTALGVGIAGGGLGLGAIAMVDTYLWGPTILGISGYATATVGFVGGLAIPFELLGIKFSVGGDIRPMVRIRAPLKNTDALALVNAIMSNDQTKTWELVQGLPAMHGVGIGLDAGATANLGGLTFAIAARDIGNTSFSYTKSTVYDIYTSLNDSGELPSGDSVKDTYYIPMDISGGVSFHPDLGGLKFLFDPMVSLDCQDVIEVLSGANQSPWKLIHIGAEATLLSLFSARAGLNQGYLTAGAGVKLLFLDANFAVFTQELGANIGDRPSSGMSFEFALRF
jgi:hypothetical protein